MQEALYKAIVAHIRAELPFIGWIDLFNAQYGNLDREDPPVFPAVFVEWGTISWTQMGEFCTEAETEITLHFATENYSSTWQGKDQASPGSPDGALEYLRQLGDIYRAFQGVVMSAEWLSQDMPLCSAWMRSQNVQDVDHDGLRIERITFTTRLYDFTAHPEWNRTEVLARLKITK